MGCQASGQAAIRRGFPEIAAITEDHPIAADIRKAQQPSRGLGLGGRQYPSDADGDTDLNLHNGLMLSMSFVLGKQLVVTQAVYSRGGVFGLADAGPKLGRLSHVNSCIELSFNLVTRN